ncbi:MAG TPA: hypothetical protein VKA95_17945 [Nitrososphaeraceae archaeon]|nr:hypothetical protein [Nitrososphaeraceae archaeon]
MISPADSFLRALFLIGTSLVIIEKRKNCVARNHQLINPKISKVSIFFGAERFRGQIDIKLWSFDDDTYLAAETL